MQYLFGFHEILEVVTNGVSELAENTTDAQRVANKEAKKKDNKIAFYIQSVVDTTDFDQISYAESAKEVWDILIKYHEGVADEHVGTKIWFLDTDCSNHMTGRKVWLVDFDESKQSKVKLVDNSSLQAEGTSDIVIQRRNGIKL
ncbi:uncharacterized protein LOC127078950 [Lathyrus oleraceus]|uniref:uncharacterized protein LOC127078950 n=1 Tax=Pisum sativum TaxID=3888 RepID=UPI0021D05E8A|nr:uncharacterized protein LOC127078950 [Pisum sativum]